LSGAVPAGESEPLSPFAIHSFCETAGRTPDPSARAHPEIPPGSFRLTDPQYAMLVDNFNNPGHGLWNLQLTFTIREALDVPRFKSAWKRLIDRHPALRTRIAAGEQGPPVQLVERDVPIPLSELDWTDRPSDRIAADIEALRGQMVLSELDFSTAPVMRTTLVKARADLFFCIWVGHHALVDGRSMYNLAYELGTLYHAGETDLPRARPFQDYVEWLDGQSPESAARFWQEHLQGVAEATALGWSRLATGPGHLGGEALRLSRAQTAALEASCERHGVTMNALVQGAWALMLRHYSGEDDVVFGSTRACRRSALDGVDGVDRMIGQFVHAVPVRARFAPGMTVLELVRDVARQHLAVRPFEHTSPLVIRKATSVPVGSRLFETIVTFERSSTAAALKSLGGFWKDWDVLDRGRNGYAVTLFAYQEPELLLRMEWHGAWIADAVASRMLRQLAHVLADMAEGPDRPAADVECLSGEDRERLVHEWNRTDVAYPQGATLHGLVEEQVARTPERRAVSFADESLTYDELNRRAERLAGALRARGVGRGSIVAVCLERSLELVISLLAVLKAGGAYLPVDPEQPLERRDFIVQDAQAQALITNGALGKRWAPAGVPTLVVGPGAPEGPAPPPLVGAGVTEADPAYVIYTSGSTGQPKGVVNSHRGIVNRLRWMQDTYALSDRDRVLQKTPIGFDVSVWELFWPLLTGAEMVVARPGGHRDPRYLVETIGSHGITVTHFVPSLLTEFLALPEAAGCRTLRLVVCSGEALPVDVQDRFFSMLPARLDNLYGPTEAAVDVTSWRCRPETAAATVPIGRPVANTRLYVMDRHQRLTPIGLPGELFIGGVQVADGYVNRPDLTASRFVPDPFAADPAARLYRTGDLVRYREDGVLEFLGRNDHQVKVRGFRIEPEEIEAAMRRHEAVRDAAVVVRQAEGESARLVAFVAFAGPDVPTTSDLRRFLRGWLPDAMIPGLVLETEELPRLPSGKIDRGALRALAETSLRPRGPRLELRTPAEREVASIWKALLKVTRVGPQDNFYELGGDSLLAVEAALALEDAFGRRIDPRLMFFQSLEQVAANVEALSGAAATAP
jgi:amino acid adenylation domain-containing protein